MTLEQQIADKLAELNSPQQVQGRGGVRWGYDPQKRAWFTEGDSLSRQAGGRYYQNTTMGIPASVSGSVSADGNVMDPGQGGGILHGNQVWDPKQGKFVTPFSLDKLATYGTLAALTAGGANAAMAGGAAAGGGALPSATIPAATGTLTTGAVAPAMTPIASAVGGAAVPGATGAVLSGTGGGRGVGADILDQIRGGNGAAALASLLPILAAASRGGGGGGNQVAMPAGLTDMLNMSAERAKRTDPLHQSITQLAMSRLPTNMQR